MNSDINILILFGENDNKSVSETRLGWVSQFKKFLQMMLQQMTDQHLNIILKNETDSITPSELNHLHFCIIILSKNYIDSDRCMNMLTLLEKSDLYTKHDRISKVKKSPVPLDTQPSSIRSLPELNMYQFDVETGKAEEQFDFFSRDAERQYWMNMLNLAYCIRKVTLAKDSSIRTKNTLKHTTVYLAETSYDLFLERNLIKRELQYQGCTVLPNAPLPADHEDLANAIKKDLHASDLSIHLMGNAYRKKLEGENQSIVDIQNHLAIEESEKRKENEKKLLRLIWISPNTSKADKLPWNTEREDKAEIVQNPFEDFKGILREQLTKPQEEKTKKTSKKKTIYVLYERNDDQAVKPYIDIIKQAGFDIIVPSFEGNLLDVRKTHIENLRMLDGAIVFRDKVGDQWVQMKILDLMKAPAFGRNKPILGKALVVTSGHDFKLGKLKDQNLSMISGDQNKSIEAMKIFLSQL